MRYWGFVLVGWLWSTVALASGVTIRPLAAETTTAPFTVPIPGAWDAILVRRTPDWYSFHKFFFGTVPGWRVAPAAYFLIPVVVKGTRIDPQILMHTAYWGGTGNPEFSHPRAKLTSAMKRCLMTPSFEHFRSCRNKVILESLSDLVSKNVPGIWLKNYADDMMSIFEVHQVHRLLTDQFPPAMIVTWIVYIPGHDLTHETAIVRVRDMRTYRFFSPEDHAIHLGGQSTTVAIIETARKGQATYPMIHPDLKTFDQAVSACAAWGQKRLPLELDETDEKESWLSARQRDSSGG